MVLRRLDKSEVPAEFIVPVSTRRRVAGIGFLLVGLVVMGYAVRVGGAALGVLPFGIAVTAASIWLLSRRQSKWPFNRS